MQSIVLTFVMLRVWLLWSWTQLLFTAFGKIVTYDFNITYTEANPDGLFMRRVIGINGQWPCPTIEVDKGDRLIVHLVNGLEDQSTSLHFHGLYMNGTTYMDGPAGVTQCAIAPGNSFTYDFVVRNLGILIP